MNAIRHPFAIAIDGPAGAGKSTIARLVAERLGFIYVDTGAMYRALTLKVLEQGLSPEDKPGIVALAEQTEIRLAAGPQGQQVWLDGRNVTNDIRTPEVNRLVPHISQIPQVRDVMTSLQRRLAESGSVVMDGRDIGSKVLPDAEVKIFLTASVEERAGRRFREMRDKGQDVDLIELQREIAQRDRMDQEREVSPLVRAVDATLLDSTAMSIDEVAQHILQLCNRRMNG